MSKGAIARLARVSLLIKVIPVNIISCYFSNEATLINSTKVGDSSLEAAELEYIYALSSTRRTAQRSIFEVIYTH